MNHATAEYPPEQIPDHEMIRCIGSGSYGQVWLAKSVMGTYRAVKIIHRKTFPAERPFEREFTGIMKFEPISRTHPGFVSVLHVGRNLKEQYFYCVMEIADDSVSGQKFDPSHYVSKTLSGELRKRGKLSVDESVRIALSLASALHYLHQQGLVHRDIKPSNIIFVNGAPKFADIGLVADIGESATFVGTEGYVPPEGPGRPTADIYSFGKLIYEMSVGKHMQEFPELPTDLGEPLEAAQLRKLYDIILKACELNARKRFQSAQEMSDQLAKLRPTLGLPESLGAAKRLKVVIVHQPGAEPDARLMTLLQEKLSQDNCDVFIDKRSVITPEWALEIERKITEADAVIPLLSPASIQSEMVAYQIDLANQANPRRVRLFPIRIQFTDPFPPHLATALGSSPELRWNGSSDNERLAQDLVRALRASDPIATSNDRPRLESTGGAVPLDSQFYLIRPVDQEFESAIARGDSIVLVKGARQMGKTSLLARGMQCAREAGAKVVLTDFQKLNTDSFDSLEKFYLALGESLADQLDLDVFPKETWDTRRSANINFERYLRREALDKLSTSLVWGLDEVDRLFACNFGSEVFGLFRSWHNKRALDPQGPWTKLTQAIAYATEASLFITDLVQSPFNVGTQVVLEDFRPDQVAELNQRYGCPLKGPDELTRFINLVGGQPFLVRRGLHELATQKITLTFFEEHAASDDGIFADHLRRIIISLSKDSAITDAVRAILSGQPCPNQEIFYRLRSGGLMIGNSSANARLRCQLYSNFLKRHLI